MTKLRVEGETLEEINEAIAVISTVLNLGHPSRPYAMRHDPGYMVYVDIIGLAANGPVTAHAERVRTSGRPARSAPRRAVPGAAARAVPAAAPRQLPPARLALPPGSGSA